MKVNTIVFDCGGTSRHDEMMLFATINSIKLAGGDYKKAPIGEAVTASLADNPDFCHYVWPGTIVVPQFYDALTSACEFAKTDFVYCQCGKVRENPYVVNASPEDFSCSQLLVRSWVVRELGVNNPVELMKRVFVEYRGTEVPHVLTMEIYP